MSTRWLVAIAIALGPGACATEFDSTGNDAEDDEIGSDTAGDTVGDTDVPEDTVSDTAIFDVTDSTGDTEVTAQCGDGDLSDGEECDDGANGDPDDGCTDGCVYSCHDGTECDDGGICNGEEICQTVESGRACESGTWMEDGFVVSDVPRIICLEGEEHESVCGDGWVDEWMGEICEPPGTGSCTWDCQMGCSGDGDCPDDGDPCNGPELCDDTTSICSHGDPADSDVGCDDGLMCTLDDWCDGMGSCIGSGNFCDDGMECTVDICDESMGCMQYIDMDFCMIEGACVGAGTKQAGEDCMVCDPWTSQSSWSPATGAACPDEGISCTDDVCDVTGACTHPVAAGSCRISDVCYGDGDPNPTNDCLYCDSAMLPTGWTSMTPGMPCDDGLACTIDDQCNALGVCSGTSMSTLVGVQEISTLQDHTCARMTDGRVACWGAGTYGQLGNGELANKATPQDVSGLGSAAVQVEAGFLHSCARLDTGEVMCWGNNSSGRLGNGTFGGNFAVAGHVLSLAGEAVDICAGGSHSCALLEDGRAMCWGGNFYGQTGNGTNGTGSDIALPDFVKHPTLGTPLAGLDDIACGGGFTCAREASSTEYWCWGYGSYGNLGNDLGVSSYRPVKVRDYPGAATNLDSGTLLDLGAHHGCTIIAGYPKCWGWNQAGQIGDGAPSPWATSWLAPDWVDLTSGAANSGNTLVDAGDQHTCSIRMDSAHCWGIDEYGQLGDGLQGVAYNRNSSSPVVTGSSGDPLTGVTDLAVGRYHTCAVVGFTHNVVCWGRRNVGQLGDGVLSGTNVLYPQMVDCI